MEQRTDHTIHLEKDKQAETDAGVKVSVTFDKGNGLTAEELAEQVTETLVKASTYIYGLVMENIENGNIDLEE